jgi:hypothetical protein
MRADNTPWADFDATASDRSAQVIQIDASKHIAVVAICAALCAVSACFAVFAFYQSTLAEREARMSSYYVTELDMTLARLEIERPAGGYESFKRKKE